jgi:hypothetical protein
MMLFTDEKVVIGEENFSFVDVRINGIYGEKG